MFLSLSLAGAERLRTSSCCRRKRTSASRETRDPRIDASADRGYDAADFVEELRTMNVRPHVARNTNGRRSAIDKRTTRHPGYAASQRIRKRIEEAFGWIKTIAGLRKTKLRGLPKVDWAFLRGRRLQPRPGAEAVSRTCSAGMDEDRLALSSKRNLQATAARAALQPIGMVHPVGPVHTIYAFRRW
jgi:hypothetical protein